MRRALLTSRKDNLSYSSRHRKSTRRFVVLSSLLAVWNCSCMVNLRVKGFASKVACEYA